MKTSAKEYFNKKAETYGNRSKKGFWKRLRSQEKAAVLQLLAPDSGEYILDAGCGAGYYAQMIQQSGAKVYGIDCAARMVIAAQNAGIKAEKQALEEMQLHRKFDKILCAGALEFCDDIPKILVNFSGHLNTDGTLVLLVPRASIAGYIYKTFHLSHGIEINLFRKSDIIKMLKKAGFDNIQFIQPHSFALVVKAVKKEPAA